MKTQRLQTPSSLWVASGLSLAISALFCWAYYAGAGRFPHWTMLSVFFLVCLGCLALTMEWLVFRKLKHLNFDNQLEIQKLRELEAYRREFLGEVSHELKTPIFAVQGFIHTLMDGAIYDETVRIKFLKKAMKNADRLSDLVEDLLIITQAESGEMEIRMRKFAIYDLVAEVMENLDYKFTRKNRSISSQIVSGIAKEDLVYADRERIQQVLTNLVENAIKYGHPDGQVQVMLNRHDRKVRVTVKDDGPGIASEHLDKIFRRFYRVDKSRSREKGGTGLGLSICKHLLEAHGESIWVESEVGKGTQFIFTLTLA